MLGLYEQRGAASASDQLVSGCLTSISYEMSETKSNAREAG